MTREQRFRELYDLTRPRLVAYALRRTANAEDAADAVADTLAIAWRRLDVVPAGEAGLLWLFATCRHVILGYGRRSRRRSELVDRIGAELRGAVGSDHDAGIKAAVALSALGSLSEPEREILMLAGWEGLDSKGLGLVLDCSPTAARIRLHRARVRLVGEMERLGLPVKQMDRSGHSIDDHQPASAQVPKEASER